MRSLLRWTSVVLFTGLSLFLIWFGVTYATVQDLLWFHAAAVPESALQDVRPIYFALMKLIGGSSAALGFLGVYVTLVPVRSEVKLAGTALAAAFLGVFTIAAFTAVELSATGAPTSWHIMGILLAINAAAYITHLASHPRGND